MKTKRIFVTVLAIVLTVAVALCVFAACNTKKGGSTTPGGTGGSGNPSRPGGTVKPEGKSVSVVFDANGGMFESTYSDIFSVESVIGGFVTQPEQPVRENFAFIGWSKTKGGTDFWNFDKDTVSDSTMLFAVWEQTNNDILSVNGGELDGSKILILVEEGEDRCSLEDRIVCGSGVEWKLYRDENCTRLVTDKVASGTDGTLAEGANVFYIKVGGGSNAKIYEVTVFRCFWAEIVFFDGDRKINTDTCYTGNEYQANFDPGFRGYTLNYWMLDGEKFVPQRIWGDIELVANKSPKNITVTLNANKGTLADDQKSQTVTYGEEFSLPVPVREGYVFDGWYNGITKVTDENGDGIDEWNIEGGELSAKWKAAQYQLTVSKNIDGAGSVQGGGSKNYDSYVTLTATTYSGYTFLGWFQNGKKLSEDPEFDYLMQLDAEVTATWIKTITKTVAENSDAGWVTQLDGAYTVGEEVEVTANTRTGYTFLGWYLEGELVSDEETITVEISDTETVYTAKWEVTRYSIQFVYDNSVGDFEAGVVLPESYTFFEEVQLPQLVAKDENGHIALGWKAADGTVFDGVIPQGTLGNLELSAIWGGHNWVEGKCSVCGMTCQYTLSDDGTKITFGTYPQSQVEDTALQSMLNAEIQNKLPSAEESNGWTDYGYYIGHDSFPEVASYTWYVDVEYNGDKYRGVYFIEYRPSGTYYYTTYTYQKDNGFDTNTVYWFKWEPITWRILSEEEGKYFLLSDVILDARQFYHDFENRQVSFGNFVRPYDYSASEIRAWLNGNFFNTAFDAQSKELILQTQNKNKPTADTLDNVFLLSYQDVCNTKYGFDQLPNSPSDTRVLKTTAYSRCQGLQAATEEDRLYSGSWWLRTAYTNSNDQTQTKYAMVYLVDSYGTSSYQEFAFNIHGVAPALYLIK